MGRALYLNKEDARDIRNVDQLLSGEHREHVFADKDFQRDVFHLFRKWRVRLDKQGDTTKPFQAVRRRRIK